MPMENRALMPGTKLIGKYMGTHYSAIVSAGEDGKLVFTVEDGLITRIERFDALAPALAAAGLTEADEGA